MPARTLWLQIPGLVAGLLIATAAVGFGQSATMKDYPHIHAAMEALNKAATELEAGGHNFGGHRAKALDLVKQAQGQLNEAVAWAKANPGKAPAKK